MGLYNLPVDTDAPVSREFLEIGHELLYGSPMPEVQDDLGATRMEQQGFPRLPLDSNKSSIHPSNLVRLTINGIVAMEKFRATHPVEQSALSSRIEQMRERTDQLQAEYEESRDEQIKLVALGLKASKDPDQFQTPYLTELAGYHQKRAVKFGSHITALEVERPRFLKIRRWFNEKKQAYHEKRVKIASAGLADLALSS